MFGALRVESLPSRMQSKTASIAFSPHSDPLCKLACWGSCTVTSKIDLLFHKSEEAFQHIAVPGAKEKKKTSSFFRLSCIDAARVPGYPIDQSHVVSSSFSESSIIDIEIAENVRMIAQRLPTITVLLHATHSNTNLLLLRPIVVSKGKEAVVRYRAHFFPVPEGVKHAVVSRSGDSIFLLAPHVSAHGGGIECYALLIDGCDARVSFRPVRLAASSFAPDTTVTVAGEVESIIWATARRPLLHVSLSQTDVVHVELLLLTDHATVFVFHVSVFDTTLPCASCVWTTHLVQPAPHRRLHNPLDLVERWKPMPCFVSAVQKSHTMVVTTTPSEKSSLFLQRFSSVPPVVRSSPNGAVLCIVAPNAHELYLVGLGTNASVCAAVPSSLVVETSCSMTVCDVAWVGIPPYGFLLLGVAKQSAVVELWHLPLTGQVPMRVFVESTHFPCLTVENDFLSFFSFKRVSDIFGGEQLQISMHYYGDGGELRTGLLSLPTITSLLPPCSPQHIQHLVHYAALASFCEVSHFYTNTIDSTQNSVESLAALSCIYDKSEHGALLTMQTNLETHLDSMLHEGVENAVRFPLHDVMHKMLEVLVNALQLYPSCGEDGNSEAAVVLLAFFHGVSGALLSLNITSSSFVVRQYIVELHSLIVILRHALTLFGQCGATSVCFAAVSCFTKKLHGDDALTSMCLEWRVLLASLFDDAFVLVASCPSLAHAILPFCSIPLQRMMCAVGDSKYLKYLQQSHQHTNKMLADTSTTQRGDPVRPLEEVLSFARRGPPGVAMLSVSDVCWAAHRLFFTEGVDSARSFLAMVCESNIKHIPEVHAVRAEYNAVDRELAAVLSCI